MTKSSVNDIESTIVDDDKSMLISIVMVFLTFYMSKTVAKRLLCLVLFAANLKVGNITKLITLSPGTVYFVMKEAKAGKAEALLHLNVGGKKGKLTDIEQAVLDKVNKNNYSSKQEIVDMIDEEFGVKTSRSAVARLLNKLGLKRLKSGSLPAKADPQKQRSFFDNTLEPLMHAAKTGELALHFVDAAHFVMGCGFLGFVYGLERRFVRTFSGRKRYNVLGALNMVTKKVTTVTNDGYMTATEVCGLLKKLAAEQVGIPLYLVLDNARYQKCKIVQELAVELNINLIYIPPYSPNLNLIERFWKYAKTKLRTKHYDDFPVFCKTIDSIVACDDVKDKNAVNNLINEKVQLFDDMEPINEFTWTKKRAA
jgi:transposase